MPHLETLCLDYGQAQSARDTELLKDRIAEQFYQDPRINRILEANLHRVSLSLDRREDLRQEVAIAFLHYVLPKLKYPERAIGAVAKTAENCVQRMRVRRYDIELASNESLDDPDHGPNIDTLLGTDDNQEDRIVNAMTMQRAKSAIERVLADPRRSTIANEPWNPTVEHSVNESEHRVPVKKIPSIHVHNTQEEAFYAPLNAPKEPNENERWFADARERLGIMIKTLSERLDIKMATLRSYLEFRVRLPADIYHRMVAFMKTEEAREMEAYYARTKESSLIELIQDWQKRTHTHTLSALAAILEVAPATVTRWSSANGAESRPHPETLFQCEQKVRYFERAQKKFR